MLTSCLPEWIACTAESRSLCEDKRHQQHLTGSHAPIHSPVQPGRPAHLNEGHDLLRSLSGIHLVVNGQESILILLHQTASDDVAISGRLDLVHLSAQEGWQW